MGCASLSLSATEQEGEGKVDPSHLLLLKKSGVGSGPLSLIAIEQEREEEVGPLSLIVTEQEKGREGPSNLSLLNKWGAGARVLPPIPLHVQ